MTPEQIAELRRQKYNATLVYLRKPNSDLAILRVRPDSGVPPHKPGQYTLLGMGFWEPRYPGCSPETLPGGEETKLARRAYSISCPVLDGATLLDVRATSEWLEFYIVLVRESDKERPPALTPRLFLLRERERLFMGDKITGNFTLDPVKPDDTVLFLSTGTGEAPHNYLLWELLRRGHPGRILAACCVRYRRDLGYRETHEELVRRYRNYTYLSLVTREPEVAGRKVYIQDLITSGELEERLGRPLDPAHTQVYLCGNPKMIGVPDRERETGRLVFPQPPGVIEILEGRGFRSDQPQIKTIGNIHYEEYW
jgi:ferredoxin/flavodoxin---NADP+ reductase